MIVGALAFSAAAHGQLKVGPARLEVSVSPAISPRTVVEIPPFGSVRAATHRGPLALVLRLEDIDIVRTTRMIGSGALSIPETISPDAAAEIPVSGIPALAWRLIGGGLAGSVFAAALVVLALRRRRAVVVLTAGLAFVLPAIVVATAYATWDITAFRAPTLRGSLVHAPQLLDVFSTRVADIERLKEQAGRLASNLSEYYADERSLASGGSLPGTYRVLHVSDLHLDPVGAELALSVARSYETSLVVDTGDLPILGADVESGVFSSLIGASVPRVYIPGNHDSPASLEALERLGVTVLASGTVEVDGLRIFGVSDPVSRGFGVEPEAALVRNAAEQASGRLRRSMRSGEATPDIVAVHNPLMESPFVGLVPIVLSGHSHSARLRIADGTVLLNSGTLGGMPYDPEKSERRPVPYGLSVLYFTMEPPRRLIAIDSISVYPTRSTTVSREVIDESLLP